MTTETIEAHIEANDEESAEFAKVMNLAKYGESEQRALITVALPMFVLGYRAAKEAAAKAAKKAEPKKDEGAFYTMDQMRNYADAFVTTRGFVVFDAIRRKIDNINLTAARLNSSGQLDGANAYTVIAAELATVLKSLEGLGSMPFQTRATQWGIRCFGADLMADKKERNQRFIEEAVELVQACGMSKREALGAVAYVYSRPVGEKRQEVGGAFTTLALLCTAHSIDMIGAGEIDLMGIENEETTARIRDKQCWKPDFANFPLETYA